jgi:hypothetical protein
MAEIPLRFPELIGLAAVRRKKPGGPGLSDGVL